MNPIFFLWAFAFSLLSFSMVSEDDIYEITIEGIEDKKELKKEGKILSKKASSILNTIKKNIKKKEVASAIENLDSLISLFLDIEKTTHETSKEVFYEKLRFKEEGLFHYLIELVLKIDEKKELDTEDKKAIKKKIYTLIRSIRHPDLFKQENQLKQCPLVISVITKKINLFKCFLEKYEGQIPEYFTDVNGRKYNLMDLFDRAFKEEPSMKAAFLNLLPQNETILNEIPEEEHLAYNHKNRTFYINKEAVRVNGQIGDDAHKALKNIHQQVTHPSVLMILSQKKEPLVLEALLQIIKESYPNLLNFLLDQKDTLGRSAMHYACSGDSTSSYVVKALLDAGFDPLLEDNLKKTPVDYAIEANKTSALKTIDDFLKNPDNIRSYDETLLEDCLTRLKAFFMLNDLGNSVLLRSGKKGKRTSIMILPEHLSQLTESSKRNSLNLSEMSSPKITRSRSKIQINKIQNFE